MSPIRLFLLQAKKRLDRHRAWMWAVRGIAVGGSVALGLELISRRRPIDPEWLALLVGAVVGASVAAYGWWRGRPSLDQVARITDRTLGGRERVATAWQLANRGGDLVSLQRSDAELWMDKADPHEVVTGGLPRREVASATVAVALAIGLALWPNPSLARQRVAESAEAAREQAADQVGELAEQVEEARPGEDPDRRQAAVDQLLVAEEALREADDADSAVAALSRAQESLEVLGSRSAAGRASAAASAGAQLAASSVTASAGAALAALGSSAPEELARLAEQIPNLSAEEKSALAAQLAERASSVTDKDLAALLERAAAELAAGRSDAAKQALADASRAQARQNATRADSEMRALADSVAAMSPEQQADLAKTLESAAAVADADPALAEALASAAAALREGKTAAASDALKAAGKRAQSLPAESALDEDVSRAANGLEATKEALLEKAEEQSSSKKDEDCPQSGLDAPDVQVGGPAKPGQTVTTWSVNLNLGCNKSEPGEEDPKEPKAAGSEQEGAGQPSQPGSGKAPGAGQPKEGGSGPGQPGPGTPSQAGPGQPGKDGQGPGGGDTGGSTGGGMTGALGTSPGAPNEQVYVPGMSAPGRSRLEQGSAGPGADSGLVPYESIYAEYQASALSQSDRQVLPERLRVLLRMYFQDAPR